MATDDVGLEILRPEECLALLAAHAPKVGRVGVIQDQRPHVLPVNYVLLDGMVVFRTGRGAKLTAALQGTAVAFEADAVDASWEEGWSVVIHGRGELVDSEDDLRQLAQLPLRPWVPAERAAHVRIVPDQVTGRSIEMGGRRRADVPPWQPGTRG